MHAEGLPIIHKQWGRAAVGHLCPMDDLGPGPDPWGDPAYPFTPTLSGVSSNRHRAPTSTPFVTGRILLDRGHYMGSYCIAMTTLPLWQRELRGKEGSLPVLSITPATARLRFTLTLLISTVVPHLFRAFIPG